MVNLDKSLENIYFGVTISLEVWRDLNFWIEREGMTKVRADSRIRKGGLMQWMWGRDTNRGGIGQHVA